MTRTEVFRVMLASLGLLAAAGSALAHHSFAAIYDPEQSVTVTGVVTNVDWLNPHAHFFVDVENEDGDVENWDFELASPNGLMRLGWRRDSLKPGDEVTVVGIPARDGSTRANTRSVTLADGSRMFSGDGQQGGLQ